VKILIVEDDPDYRELLASVLQKAGARVQPVGVPREASRNIREACDGIRSWKPDLVLLDLELGSGDWDDGIRILDEFAPRQGAWRIVRQIEPAFIVITRLNEAEPAVQAMERGVWGFLVKRRTSDYPRIVVDTIRHAWSALRAWRAMVCELREDVIAESKQMKEVMREAETAAMSDSLVLLQGEAGSGKDLIARQIHLLSKREGRFVARNCAKLTETLAESALFGHKKGAFQGADADRKGWFQDADKGTLFLDEIGSLQPEGQNMLLRVLETGEVLPIGADEQERVKVDVKVITADFSPLDELVLGDTFRFDLLSRIVARTIRIPPLRERPEDIKALAEHYVELFALKRGWTPVPLTPSALERLVQYPWPANVRQLRQVIEKTMDRITERDRIDEEDLAFSEADELLCRAMGSPSNAGHRRGSPSTEAGPSMQLGRRSSRGEARQWLREHAETAPEHQLAEMFKAAYPSGLKGNTNDDDLQVIARVIRRLRRSSTQREVAKQLGLSVPTVRKYEKIGNDS
jgi:two-component system NtrC family response regulator